MPDLETRLGELGARWEAPPTPNLVDAVMQGRQTAHVPARRTRPRRLVLALAASAVALGALAAIAPARNAILDFFDIGGVRVVTTPTTAPPPPATETAPSADTGPLGTPISLAAARARARFPLLVPTVPAAQPDQVYIQTPPRDGAFAFVWSDAGAVARGQLVLTEFSGQLVATKTIDPLKTTVEEVDVDGATGFWLSGGPHTIGYLDDDGAFRSETTRAVGDVLVWERSGVTYRVEGAADRDAALRVAASLR